MIVSVIPNSIAKRKPISPHILLKVATPKKDRSHWVVKKFDSFDEQRKWQVEQWQNVSGAKRREAAWELVYDYWVGMKGTNPDELRLQRSITKLTKVPS